MSTRALHKGRCGKDTSRGASIPSAIREPCEVCLADPGAAKQYSVPSSALLHRLVSAAHRVGVPARLTAERVVVEGIIFCHGSTASASTRASSARCLFRAHAQQRTLRQAVLQLYHTLSGDYYHLLSSEGKTAPASVQKLAKLQGVAEVFESFECRHNSPREPLLTRGNSPSAHPQPIHLLLTAFPKHSAEIPSQVALGGTGACAGQRQQIVWNLQFLAWRRHFENL